uniref:Uncharacterized protein n=1 Tax=Anopheles melas TaxID=34690 RepID=A0A182TVM3_9DIPT
MMTVLYGVASMMTGHHQQDSDAGGSDGTLSRVSASLSVLVEPSGPLAPARSRAAAFDVPAMPPSVLMSRANPNEIFPCGCSSSSPPNEVMYVILPELTGDGDRELSFASTNVRGTSSSFAA